MIFRRRGSPSHLIVTTNVMKNLSTHMPAPQGPLLPMSQRAQRADATAHADQIAAVRDSGTVIAFLSTGGVRSALNTRVYDVITAQEGCGLGRASSPQAFAAQFCDTAEGRRRLAQSLAVHRPTSDPTALLTRQAVTAWVRTVGLAMQPHTSAESVASGLPDWHVPGDV